MTDNSRNVRESIASRIALKAMYTALFHQLTDIFYRYDPIGISYRWDEYEPEVGTILPRLLNEARSADDVRELLIQEFTRWFDEPGREDVYIPMAQEVWDAKNRIGAR